MNKNKYLVYHRNSINGTFITILISPSLPSSPIHRAHWFISCPILSLLGFLYSLYLPSSIIFSGNDVSVLWLLESRPDVKGIFSLLLLLPFQQIHTVAIDVLFSNGERQIAAHSLPWGPFKSFSAVSFEERMAIHPWGHNLTLWIKGHILYCVGSGSPTAPYGVLSCLSKQANRKETLLNLVCSTYFEPKRSGIKYPYYLRKKSFEQRTVSIGKQRMAVDPWFCIVDSLGEHFKNPATQTPFLPVGTRFFESWVPDICSSEKSTGCPIPSKDQCKMFQKFFMGLQHSKKNKAKEAGFS